MSKILILLKNISLIIQTFFDYQNNCMLKSDNYKRRENVTEKYIQE